MCYHASKAYQIEDVIQHYNTTTRIAFDKWQPYYHENGFDHNTSPVMLSEGLGNFSWGFIPWYTKTLEDALKIRNQTLNCISEEMFDKPAYRDSIKEGKRCLIPVTGFYEWRWVDDKGKEKIPNYIFLKGQKIFSVAGIYSAWHNKATDEDMYTYSVLTTKANKMMEYIHNSKKRMPVIIAREFEKDWLNPNLTKDDVLALCQPLDDSRMDSFTISKRITSRKEPTNVPEVLAPFTYEKTTLF